VIESFILVLTLITHRAQAVTVVPGTRSRENCELMARQWEQDIKDRAQVVGTHSVGIASCIGK
jgi:hypothetical protein